MQKVFFNSIIYTYSVLFRLFRYKNELYSRMTNRCSHSLTYTRPILYSRFTSPGRAGLRPNWAWCCSNNSTHLNPALPPGTTQLYRRCELAITASSAELLVCTAHGLRDQHTHTHTHTHGPRHARHLQQQPASMHRVHAMRTENNTTFNWRDTDNTVYFVVRYTDVWKANQRK